MDEIDYKSPYSFSLWCETNSKAWFEIKRDTYEKCKNKMIEFENKFGNTIQLEILYIVDANY